MQFVEFEQKLARASAQAFGRQPLLSHAPEREREEADEEMRFDPATSSAPFIATLVDVTGLIMYISVAFMIMRGTML